MTRKNWMTTDHSDDKKCRAVAPSIDARDKVGESTGIFEYT